MTVAIADGRLVDDALAVSIPAPSVVQHALRRIVEVVELA
jgi:hypothetical protein